MERLREEVAMQKAFDLINRPHLLSSELTRLLNDASIDWETDGALTCAQLRGKNAGCGEQDFAM